MLRWIALKWILNLCVVLLGSALPVYGAEPAHFAALRLERLASNPPVPDVTLPDLQGKPVALRSLQGKVVLLNFWTTW